MAEKCGGSKVLERLGGLTAEPCPGCPDCRPCTRCNGTGFKTSDVTGHPFYNTDLNCPRCNGTGVEPAPDESPAGKG